MNLHKKRVKFKFATEINSRTFANKIVDSSRFSENVKWIRETEKDKVCKVNL